MYVLVWRPRRGSILSALGLLLVLAVLAAGRGPEAPLRVAVPESLLPTATEVVTAYTAARPEAQVDLLPVAGEEEAARLVRARAAEAALVRGAPASPLSLVQVGWEAVAAVTGLFTPPGNLTVDQVVALLSGEAVAWREVAPGATGHVRLVWPSGNAALPLLADFLAARRRPLRPGRVVGGLSAFREKALADPAVLGFVPATSLVPGLRPLTIGGARSEGEDLAAGRYALSRPLFLAIPAGRPSGAARALVQEARRHLRGTAGRVATIALAGDFLPDGPVGAAIKANGPEWPWGGVAPLTSACDAAICNLEAPLSTLGWPINQYRGDPAAVRGLRLAGIDAVTLANDHILDYDDPALLSTIALLDREGVGHAGAGATLARARTPAVLTVQGMRVALLAYGRPELGRSKTGRRWDASPWSPGIAPAVTEEVVEDVRRARQEVQVVLVAIHWGEEGAEAPRPEDRLLARAALEAGATAVVGGGAGMAQGFEVYGEGVILYGLGPFVRQEYDPVRKLGVVALLRLVEGRLAGVELVPVWNEHAHPSLLAGSERAFALRLLNDRTQRLPALPLSPGAGKPELAWYVGGRGRHPREQGSRD